MSESNGTPHDEPKPIVITLTLLQSPQGYAMQIGHDPSIFADQIIDACQRAARFYKRIALMQAIEQRGQTLKHQTPRIIGMS